MSTQLVDVRTRTKRGLRDRLAYVAHLNRRSLAEELRIAIEQHVEAAELASRRGEG